MCKGTLKGQSNVKGPSGFPERSNCDIIDAFIFLVTLDNIVFGGRKYGEVYFYVGFFCPTFNQFLNAVLLMI